MCHKNSYRAALKSKYIKKMLRVKINSFEKYAHDLRASRYRRELYTKGG
jgi:hypothetical protein